MDVTIRDRRAESWGHGLLNIVTKTITIPDTCPKCGEKRGTPERTSFHEDGVSYSVDTWTNPCGHVDFYEQLLHGAALPSDLLA